MKIQVLHTFKSYIAEAALLMVGFAAMEERFPNRTARRWIMSALFVLAVLSVAAYFDFGRYAPIPFYVNRHDFFHYYMGPKYSKEIGYLNLYPCALIVDQENGAWFNKPSVRNQTDYSFIPVEEVMAHEASYKALFSESRWHAFEKDVLFLRSFMGNERWQKALRDKGYNATPVWNMVGRVITNAIPLNSERNVRQLLLLDLSLMVIMFIVVCITFGARTMLFAMIFFGVNFMMNQTHIKGSILRLDWVTFLVISSCMIKLKHYKTAGILAGYAALSRIFPAVFFFGMGAKLIWVFIKTRRIPRYYWRFFGAAAATVAIVLAISVAVDGGLDRWATYQQIIRMHNDDVVGVRTGFKYVFLMTYRNTEGSLTAFKELKNAQFHDPANRIVWWAIQAGVLLAAFFAAQRLEDYETIPFGFVPAYFLAAPTFYYYVMLIVPFFLFAPKLGTPRRAVGLGLLFALSVVGYLLYKFMGLDYPLFFWNSVLYLGFAMYILYAVFKTPVDESAYPPRKQEEAPAPA